MNKIETMEIEWECMRLSNAFAHLLDRKEYRQFSALFTEDGVFVRNGARLVGRAAIFAALTQRPSNAITRHVTTGMHFQHVAADSARAISCNRSYFGMLDGEPPANFKGDQVILLDFEDIYAKTAAGWRFAERITSPVLLPDVLRPMFGLSAR